MDIQDWYAPEETDADPDEYDFGKIGLISHGGQFYTPEQVEGFAAQLVEMAAFARAQVDDDGFWIDRSVSGFPRRVKRDHIDADADHEVVRESAGDELSDTCEKCGLATTSDGKRHGFDA